MQPVIAILNIAVACVPAAAALALFSSLAAAAAHVLANEGARPPALLTFLTAASGVTIPVIGAAFRGLIAGLVLLTTGGRAGS